MWGRSEGARRRSFAVTGRPTRSRSSPAFHTYSATKPFDYLDTDSEKRAPRGATPSRVFQALQASLGGYFVNNVHLFGALGGPVPAEDSGPPRHR